MKNLAILGLIFASTISIFSDGNICYEYPQNDIKLVHITMKTVGKNDWREIKKDIDPSPYRLIIAKSSKPSKLHWHYVYLLNKNDNKVVTYQSLECSPKKGFIGGFRCHGECDTGSTDIDRNGDLIVTSDNIVLGESVDTPEGEWDMSPKKKNGILKANLVPCPEYIKNEKFNDDQYVADSYIESVEKESSRKARYVCYTSKTISATGGESHPVYSGCQVSKDPCKDAGLLHFGHYRSDLTTDEALARCKKSSPRNR